MLWSKLALIFAVQLAASFVLGRIAIPFFRRLKTGKFDFYVGDRFRQDGSEPKLGGAVMAAVLLMGAVPAMSAADFYSNSGSGKYPAAIAIVYALLVGALGAAEDILKGFCGQNAGLKLFQRNSAVFALSLFALIMLKITSGYGEEVLLPFRIGYIDTGWTYYPIGAAFMTLTVSAVKVHDCFGGDVKSGIDGLCCISFGIFSAACYVCAGIMDNTQIQALCGCGCAVAAGMLFWGLAPAKLYIGESGAMLMGGLAAIIPALLGLHLILPLAGIVFAADGICSAAQYLVFRRYKKLLFKGNSLHSHLSEKNINAYRMIGIFAAVSVLGGAAAVAFAIYAEKLQI